MGNGKMATGMPRGRRNQVIAELLVFTGMQAAAKLDKTDRQNANPGVAMSHPRRQGNYLAQTGAASRLTPAQRRRADKKARKLGTFGELPPALPLHAIDEVAGAAR